MDASEALALKWQLLESRDDLLHYLSDVNSRYKVLLMLNEDLEKRDMLLQDREQATALALEGAEKPDVETNDEEKASAEIAVSEDTLCVACVTPIPSQFIITCPCDHKYCSLCLREHFRSGIEGSTFPPSCCKQPIPLDLARPHLTPKLISSFNDRQERIDNPMGIYCALLSCQSLLISQDIDEKSITCTCGAATCVICRFIGHEGTCSNARERTALLQLAVSEGLRACYRCGELYDREGGCNHMKCTKCQAEFCYNCGGEWNTCACTDYEAQAGPLIRTGEVEDDRVLPEVCFHEGEFRRISATRLPPIRCLLCAYAKGKWLYKCTGCHYRTCAKCLPTHERVRRGFELAAGASAHAPADTPSE